MTIQQNFRWAFSDTFDTPPISSATQNSSLGLDDECTNSNPQNQTESSVYKSKQKMWKINLADVREEQQHSQLFNDNDVHFFSHFGQLACHFFLYHTKTPKKKLRILALYFYFYFLCCSANPFRMSNFALCYQIFARFLAISQIFSTFFLSSSHSRLIFIVTFRCIRSITIFPS